ncbi:hypothetical protein NC653_025678 [Populus alba x Populus x berolinensis]|uniref:Uncharacterized protein n=1 Tax=Populus alba x Populus x berolinensis TaxID=444605 RepID=A0AAD6Q8A3_9ROSI|nr:hypothetical protein NC653_025678 [Populus alba x Populus x berolinensis]
MSSDTPSSAADTNTAGASSPSPSETMTDKQKEKARVTGRPHQNDAAAVRKLLEEDPSLVRAMDYDSRTPLHVGNLSMDGSIRCQRPRIAGKNTPLADAEGAKKHNMIELLKSYGGLSYGQNGSHFEPKPVPPPLTNKCDWEIEPSELDFSNSNIIGKCQDFRPLRLHLLSSSFRHPNIVQFLGAVTDRKPLMLITEYLRGWCTKVPSTAYKLCVGHCQSMA